MARLSSARQAVSLAERSVVGWRSVHRQARFQSRDSPGGVSEKSRKDASFWHDNDDGNDACVGVRTARWRLLLLLLLLPQSPLLPVHLAAPSCRSVPPATRRRCWSNGLAKSDSLNILAGWLAGWPGYFAALHVHSPSRLSDTILLGQLRHNELAAAAANWRTNCPALLF